MNNKVFVLGAAILIAVIFGVTAFQKKPSPAPSREQTSPPQSLTESQMPSAELFVRSHSPRFGNEMARVVVVEWLDPECEACRSMHPSVKKMISEFGDRVLFVVRFMPYHSGSMFAASTLHEAKELGKFEEALSILFDKQPEWGDHHQPRPDLIPTYLAKIGIPAKKLDREKVTAKHADKINQDKADGEKVGVQGTPSFYVNQKPLLVLGEEELRGMIERELAASRN